MPAICTLDIPFSDCRTKNWISRFEEIDRVLTRLNFDFHLVSRRLARVGGGADRGECRVTFFPNDPRCRLGVGQNLMRSLASWESVERCKGPFTYDVRQVVLLTLTQLICTERDWVVLQLKVNSQI